MAEEEPINDFLLDQELEPDEVPGENDLPDDIDAILDAVEDEDISTMPQAETSDSSFDDFTNSEGLLDEPVEGDDVVTENDLDQEVNIASSPVDYDDDIPVIKDIIDPNHPPAQTTNTMMTLSDDMMFEIMAKIQRVVEESVNSEIGKLANTVRDNVVQDVKEQLPAVLSKVLKGK